MLLMRRLGGSPRAGVVAALVWALSGYTASAWVTGVLLAAGAWIPWCALGFVALVRSGAADGGVGHSRGIFYAALPVAMAFAVGEVFFAAMGIGAGSVLALAEACGFFGERQSIAVRRRLRLAGALVLAIGLGAVTGGGMVIIPARAAAQDTERARPLPRVLAETWSFHPLRLIELVAPEALGDPDAHYPGARIVGDRGTTWPLVPSVYLGAGAMLLVLGAFRRRDRAAPALGGLAILGLSIALGRFFVVHRVLRWLVPPLSYMRFPEKYLVVVVFAVALLAGLGADRVWASGFRMYKRSLFFLGALAALALTAESWFAPDLAAVMRAGAWRGACAAGLMLGVVVLGYRRASWAAVMMVALIGVDLSLAAWPRLSFGPASLASPPPVVEAIRRHADDPLAPPRVLRMEAVERSVARFVPATSMPEGQRRGGLTLPPNLAAAFGLASVPGYDAAVPASLTRVWDAQPDGTKLMRLLALEFVIAPVDNPQTASRAPDGLTPILDPAPGARLFKAKEPLPRVYLAANAEVIPEAAALPRLAEPEVLEGRTVFLAPSATASPLGGPLARAGRCSLSFYANTHIEARCDADREAVAVFVEQYDRGWRAEVDGSAAPLERANLVGRAVRLPPGSHRVALTFEPPGRVAGFALSGLGGLAMCCCWLYSRRRRSRVAKV